MSQKTPLFQAITRPSERGGMPAGFHIVALSAPMMLFIMTQSFLGFWGLLSIAPAYFLAWYVNSIDPYLPDLLSAKSDCWLFTTNKPHWGGNSYAGE